MSGVLALPMAALEDVLASWRQPGYRAKQLFDWLHNKQAASFGEMSNLPSGLREKLEEAYKIEQPAIETKQVSADGTIKYLFRYEDGSRVEAVLMEYHHGHSLCISSQVGCRMGCRFCASASGGLARNLTAGEMLGEVYAAGRDAGVCISHIVLMGVGEPLDNFDNVLGFIALVTDEKGMNLSGRHISLSTCGLVPKIYKLAEYRLGLTLSVSLHAAQNAKRSAMMPVNDVYSIEEVLQACRDYQKTTGRRVSFEYALVAGENDTAQDAADLALLLQGMAAHVNLIPVNPVAGTGYSASDKKRQEFFLKELIKRGVNATVRRRLGSDISAACGQLRAATQNS